MLKRLLLLTSLLSFFIFLTAIPRGLEIIFPEIYQPVYDMQYGNFDSNQDMVFLLGGDDGGLAFYDQDNNLQIYEVHSTLPLVAIYADVENNRVLCACGNGSYSDGLYAFDMTTFQITLIQYAMISSAVIKKLSNGYYFGFPQGLYYSEDGVEWDLINCFTTQNIVDIEETNTGNIFIAADNMLYLQNDSGYSQFPPLLQITDLFVSSAGGSEQVYFCCGGGSDSDSVHRLEYADGIITESTLINYAFYPNKLFEFENKLVVGSSSPYGCLSLLEPVPSGIETVIETPGGINSVHCFQILPINTPHFICGTNMGILMATNLITDNEDCNEAKNYSITSYPNPFSLSIKSRNLGTTFLFSIPESGNANLTIFNMKGQITTTLINNHLKQGDHSIAWNGRDNDGKLVSTGIYFYCLSVDGKIKAIGRSILLK
jgi:hypothetical protein